MNREDGRNQQVFVVRAWQEVSTLMPVCQWRGCVEHLGTDQRRFFGDLQEIDRFVRGELGLLPPARPDDAAGASPA